jgi:hypothetical protein
MKASPQLQIPAEAYALPDAATVSEVLRKYARPLLYIDPEGPADLETLRTAAGLAMICWNLPVYEAIGSPLYAQGMQTLDKIKKQVPAPVGACLRRLLEDRKTKFAELPYLASVEVVGDDLSSAKIAAEARRPRRA